MSCHVNPNGDPTYYIHTHASNAQPHLIEVTAIDILDLYDKCKASIENGGEYGLTPVMSAKQDYIIQDPRMLVRDVEKSMPFFGFLSVADKIENDMIDYDALGKAVGLPMVKIPFNE
jgi:hypothetical protein